MDNGMIRLAFNYLDELRDSGETNMWGAGPYVQREFGLSNSDSRKIHGLWMNSFDYSADFEERVSWGEKQV